MGRHDGREERSIERLVSELEIALARRQARDACAALVKLPPAHRSSRVAAAAVLFRSAVGELHARGSYGDMGFFAARAEEEPGLVAAGADASEADEARWAIFVGMGHTRDWARASALLAALEPALATAPDVRETLRSYVAGKGEPDPALVERLPLADPRLGYDAVKSVAPPPSQPRAPAEAEAATLRLRVSGTFDRFASTLQTWLSQLAPETALVVQAVAVPLAAREALELLRGGRDARAATRLLARLATNLPWTSELEADLLPVFRAAAARLRRVPATDPNAVADYAALLPVLGASERWGPGVRGHLLSQRFLPEASTAIVEAARRLLEQRPDPLLWAKGARLFFLADERRAPETWLVAGLRAVLAIDGWAVALATMDEAALASTLRVFASGGYPDELSLPALEALLAAAPAERRREVVEAIAERLEAALAPDDAPRDVGFGSFLGGLDLAVRRSTPRARELARRFARLAAESEHLLELVLAAELPDREALPIVEAFLGPRPTALRFRQALAAAAGAEAGGALDYLESRMFGSDVTTLVDLWALFADGFGAPREFLEQLAGRILVATDSLSRPDERTRDVMTEARAIVRGRSPAKKKKKPAPKRPVKKPASGPPSPKPREATPPPAAAAPATEEKTSSGAARPGPTRKRAPRQTRLFGSDE